jgi:hypothetical protein
VAEADFHFAAAFTLHQWEEVVHDEGLILREEKLLDWGSCRLVQTAEPHHAQTGGVNENPIRSIGRLSTSTI